MAKRGKPEGNKRQRERDKRRKKEEKAERKRLRKEGLLDETPGDGDGENEDAEGNAGAAGEERDVDAPEDAPQDPERPTASDDQAGAPDASVTRES